MTTDNTAPTTPDSTLATTYDPATIEANRYAEWEDKGYFKPSGTGTPFSIMIPPPNVTGSLHMGHGFNNAIMDALTRFHRMKGHNTLWQVGTDHAGIATQMVVERQLGAQGISRHDLGREKFLDKVWEWKEQSGGTITQQIRRLGSSVDWSRERFTMDDGLSNAVKEVFVRLHEEGLIYRGKRLVNWDPKLHTALSDLEVESVEEQGSLWHFRYRFAEDGVTTRSLNEDGSVGDGVDYLVVATTRPETLLGDTAVAVHPEDDRYKHLIGHFVRLPITDRLVPIVADDYVEKDFGTGCVKITPAHDFNDFELGKRHNLPIINILNKDAAILGEFDWMEKAGQPVSKTIIAPEDYVGLDRYARAVQQHVHGMDEQPARLVHQPSVVVGPSHSGMVRRARQHLCRPRRSRSARQAWLVQRHDATPRRRRARHLVLLSVVDLLHLGLARKHPRTENLPQHRRVGDGF